MIAETAVMHKVDSGQWTWRNSYLSCETYDKLKRSRDAQFIKVTASCTMTLINSINRGVPS